MLAAPTVYEAYVPSYPAPTPLTVIGRLAEPPAAVRALVSAVAWAALIVKVTVDVASTAAVTAACWPATICKFLPAMPWLVTKSALPFGSVIHSWLTIDKPAAAPVKVGAVVMINRWLAGAAELVWL